jgi:ABC-type antimicrobial peptide transport system permease subunit
VFAAAALVLAIVGLYGALSVTVAQRRVEIGIRLALGARGNAIRRMVFLNGLRPVLLGLTAGSVAAVFALRAMGELMFAVRPLDPASLGGAVGALLLAGAGACLVPAWRAARIDPATSLRAE